MQDGLRGKLALVTKADLLFELERLVDNFVPSKQLDDRLATMAKQLGVKPMTLEELRAMPDRLQPETKPVGRNSQHENP